MRSIELFYVIFNIVLLGWLVFGRNKSQRGILIAGGMSMLFLLVHGIIEGMRWQMIPTYLMTLFFLVVVVIRPFLTQKFKRTTIKYAPITRCSEFNISCTLFCHSS